MTPSREVLPRVWPVRWPVPVSCFGRTWWAQNIQDLHWLIRMIEKGILPS